MTHDNRSVQQLSECTDGSVLDQGSQLERTNVHCESGFPDVHMDYMVNSLNGALDSDDNIPENVELGTCRNPTKVTFH